MSKVGKDGAYEFGALRFSDPQGLSDILARGYFREGSAWGSVRRGWGEVVPWTRVLEVLRRSCPGGWVAATSSAGGSGWRFNGPMAVAQGAGLEEGARLWLRGASSGFGPALGELWGEIEASEIDQQVAAAPKPKAKSKGRAGPARAPAPERPPGPRRL